MLLSFSHSCLDCADGQAGSEGKGSEGNRNSLPLQEQQVRGQGRGEFLELSSSCVVCVSGAGTSSS